MDNQTEVSIKFKNSVTGEKKLEQYVETLTKIKSVLGSIDKGAAQQIESSAKSTKDVSNNVDEMSKKFNLAFDYTALRTFTRGLSKVVEGFSSMTAKSTAFLEDFNLFQVAFRGNYTEATKFVNKLSEMYGLDEDWLVKTTAQFKQLSNAMGLANETGEKVSKLMTQLSIDISSLYNIDVDRASSILQSAMAGQTKPVRALGADITQASLQQTLDRLDISNQVSQLSYAEKRLLIMISLTQQLSGVTNDWGRTLESPSNQIRIMNEQWQRLQRNVGNIFLQTVGKVLPYLNAVLMVLNEIAKVIASLFGFKLGDFDYFDEMSVGVEEFGDALDSANDSANKLKQGLRGFDKLNVITTPSAGGSTGGGGVGGGVNPQLMDAFNKAFDEYNKKLSEVQMKATKIRDKIMEWLGFTKQIDEETGEVSFKFDHITSGTLLGALALGGSIYKGINFIFKILQKIGLIKFGSIKELVALFKDGKIATNLTKFTTGFTKLASALGISAGALAAIVAAIVAVGAALIYAYNHNDKFKEKVDTMVKTVVGLFQTLLDKATIIFNEMWKIIEPIWNNTKDTIEFVVKYLYETVVFWFSGIADFITGIADAINKIIEGDFQGAFDSLENMVANLYENWKNAFNNVRKHFEEWTGKIWENVQEFIPKVIEKMKELPDWLEKLPEKFGYWTGEAIKWLKKKIDETDWWQLGQDIVTKIVSGIFAIRSLLDGFGNKTKNAIINSLNSVNWWDVGNNILKGIVNGMWNFGGVGLSWGGSWASGFINGIKDALGIHSPAQVIIDAKIGDFSMEAIAIGMERQLPLIEKEAESIVDSLNKGIQEASIDTNFSYDLPQFDASSMLFDLQNSSDNKANTNKTTINPTIIVQVGNKEIAKQVITDLQDMAKDNGKPIMIGG